MDARQFFLDQIDSFTARFMNTLKDVDRSKELAEF